MAAKALITRNEEHQYGLLRDYVEMIKRTDVGSMVILQNVDQARVGVGF